MQAIQLSSISRRVYVVPDFATDGGQHFLVSAFKWSAPPTFISKQVDPWAPRAAAEPAAAAAEPAAAAAEPAAAPS